MHSQHRGRHDKVVIYAPQSLTDFNDLPLNYVFRARQGDPPPDGTRGRSVAALKRFFLWWLAFAGIYAGSSVCPFCGQPNCPVGPGAAGLVGALFAAGVQYGKVVWAQIRDTGTKLFRSISSRCC